MAFNLWLVFVFSAFGLACVPGPNSLLVLSHSARYGHQHTLWTILGGIGGFFVLIAISMFGLGALLQTNPEAMRTLQWLGAGYLVWLGLKLCVAPALQITESNNIKKQQGADLMRQGFLAAFANPKVLLFFIAFLAQFIDPQRALLPQFFIIAATFLCVEFLVEYSVARVATLIRPFLLSKSRLFNRCCGVLFISLAVSLTVN